MAFTSKQKYVLFHAITKWGERQQVNKAIEEFSELIQRLAKWQNRDVTGPGFDKYGDLTPIHEEMADAEIMLEQLKQIFGRKEIEPFINRKIVRLQGYLNWSPEK